MGINQSRILRESVILANRRGLHGLSMSELAKALKIRTPSLYSHVEGIDDVRRLLALHGLGELDRTVSRVTVDAVNGLKGTCLASLREFDLRGPEVVHAFRGLRSLVHGFVSLESSGALKNPVDRDESFAWLIDSFLFALGKVSSRSLSE